MTENDKCNCLERKPFSFTKHIPHFSVRRILRRRPNVRYPHFAIQVGAAFSPVAVVPKVLTSLVHTHNRLLTSL